MGYREDTAALNQITIQEIGNLLGLRLPGHGTFRCPFPDHEDKTPSFELKRSGTYWICYGCQRRGGSIDFVKSYYCIGFLEAKAWLADRIKLSTISLRSTRRPTPDARTPPPSLFSRREPPESAPDYELYKALLQRAPLQESGLQYLLSRGLSKNTISTHGIGQLPNRMHFLTDMVREYGYRRLENAGLFTKSSTANSWRFLLPSNSLLFPFFESEQIAYFQARRLFVSKSQRKWCNLNHRKRRIFNLDAFFSIGHTPFAICEGPIDTLSAIELGYDAIGLLGVNMQLHEDYIRRLRGVEVVILLDWDTQGEARAAKLQNQLRRFGIASTRKRRPTPSVTDVNDYLVETKA